MSEKPLATIFSCGQYRLKFMGFFLIGLMILSCSGLSFRDARPHGVYHRVKNGETLSAIARAYRVDLQELAEINNIRHSDRIEPDSVIFVPDANQILDDIMIAARPREPSPALPARAKPVKNETAVVKVEIPKSGAAADGKRRPPPAEAAAKNRPVPFRAAEGEVSLRKSAGTSESGEKAGPPVGAKEGGEKPEQIRFDKKRFIWPVKGTVISPFGIQPNRMYFNGIRIEAGAEAPVQAAADGVVIFSAPLKDYGETIIIQHEDHYATVYAHLGVRTVRGEARVKKGGRIAFTGKAASKEESSLHFEIRHNNKARNPLFFLP